MILDIREQTGQSLRFICKVLDLPRSSFYHGATPTASEIEAKQLGDLIEALFEQHQRRYGHRRLAQELAAHQVPCGLRRVRRLMLQRALRPLFRRRFHPQGPAVGGSAPAPNLLKGNPLPTQLNTVWTSDITYIHSRQGWLYLAVVIDLCSRRLIGWHLDNHLRAELVTTALSEALHTRPDRAPGLVLHSDRGIQYDCDATRKLLHHNGMRQSMSAAGNPYHNAWTESFIGTLKRELIHQTPIFEGLREARSTLFNYFKTYYNPRRRHSALNYLSPNQFEELLELQPGLPLPAASLPKSMNTFLIRKV